MSVVFYLRGSRFTVPQWNVLLARWVEARKIQPYDEPQFDDQGDAHIWGPGSIRGVVLSRSSSDGNVEITLYTFASRQDWMWAFDIMRQAVKNGGGTVERGGGEAYGMDRLVPKEAESEAVRNFICAAECRRESTVFLPLGFFSMPLSPKEIAGCTLETLPKIEQALAARVQKYASAYRASIIELKDGTKLSTWALIPTVVGQVDRISIDWKGGMEIGLADLKAILVPRAEDLKGITFLPALDPQRDAAVLQAIEKKAVRMEQPQDSGDSLEPIGRLAKQLVESALSARVAEDVSREYPKMGVDKRLIDALIYIVGFTLQGLQQRKRAEQIMNELLKQGVPVDVLDAAFRGISEALESAGG